MNFNSHAHVERDFSSYIYETYVRYFNSHAHVERDYLNVQYKYDYLNFNSHAHVERDARTNIVKQSDIISTHTLTWSVTRSSAMDMIALKISTHTLTWSVT